MPTPHPCSAAATAAAPGTRPVSQGQPDLSTLSPYPPIPHADTFRDTALLAGLFHSGPICPTSIPCPRTQEPQILPTLQIPTLRPCSTCFPPGRKPAGRPYSSRRKPPPSGHRTLPLCASCGLDRVVKCLGSLWSYLERLHAQCLPYDVYLVLYLQAVGAARPLGVAA